MVLLLFSLTGTLKSHWGLYKLSKNGYNTMVIIYALMRNAWDALSRSEPETGASPDGSIHRESPRSSEPNADGWSVGLAGFARYSEIKWVRHAAPIWVVPRSAFVPKG